MKKILLSLALACFAMTATSYAQTFFSENFSGATIPGMPTGWTNLTTGLGNGWVSSNTSVSLYFGSVPVSAPHATYAIVDEYNHPGNNPATMTSPTFSLAAAAHPYLSYDYFYYNAKIGTPDTLEVAWVDLSTTGGASWTTIDTIRGGTAWMTKFVDLSSAAGMPSCQLRFQYMDKFAHLIGVAVTNIKVYDPASSDMALTFISPNSSQPSFYGAGGTAVNFSGTAFNNSYNTVTTFSVVFQQGATAPVSYTFTGLSIAPFTSYNFTDATAYTMPATAGNYPFKVWVAATGDVNGANDTLNTSLTSVAFMPNKRILFEEPTGSWCGYCVRGIVFMDSLWGLHSDKVSIVSVHGVRGTGFADTDPMYSASTITKNYDNFIHTLPGYSGYPGIFVDRHFNDDPSAAFVYYNGMSQYFGFADMTISAKYTPAGIINVKGTVKPALAMSGDYRVELVLTEDNVHNNSYDQHNYYSFQTLNEELFGAGYNFKDSVADIPGSSMYYKFVDRYTVPDIMSSPTGVASSLPATMAAGTSYDYSFTPVTVASDWVAANMRAVVLLIDNNSTSATYKQVLNSINVNLVSTVAVQNVNAGVDELRVFPNPAKSDAHVRFGLKNAGKVQFAITDVLGRTVFSVPAEQMNAGGQQINFSTSEFTPGIYNVTITTETGTESTHLTVTK